MEECREESIGIKLGQKFFGGRKRVARIGCVSALRQGAAAQ